MKKILLAIFAATVLAVSAYFVVEAVPEEYKGVDDTVVGKFAEEAGRKPRAPLINTDKGDLILFCFLLAGAAGGFVAGYCYRELFPPQ